MKKRIVSLLLNQAADEHEDFGSVFSDTEMRLAAEGYALDQLEADIESILAKRQAQAPA